MVTGNSINNAIVAGTTIIFDSVGVIEINSTGGAISIGNDADAQAINIGIAGARTVTIGNGTGATSVVVDCGTGALNLGANAIARTTTLGNTTGASVLALNCGTGDFTLASATGTIIRAEDTGEVTMPLQSAFLAYVGDNVADQTGAGAVATIVYDTEVFDQNADYAIATGIFTAPIEGQYNFAADVGLSGNVAGTASEFKLVTTLATYTVLFGYNNSWTSDNKISYIQSMLTHMDAGDTAYLTIKVSNGAGDTIDIIGVGTNTSHFSGYLAC